MVDIGRAPVIVLGAHRSGTTLVARTLDGLGVFMGAKRDPNHEAYFFQRLNEWVFRHAGARWDHPAGLRRLHEAPEARDLVAGYLGHVVRSPRTARYLGRARYVRQRLSRKRMPSWGWKDPRNTFTLPFWLETYPDARIVHVLRHGVDVAHSLQRRARAILADSRTLRSRGALYSWRRPNMDGFTDSVRCLSMEGGFSLWEEYVAEARRWLDRLDRPALELRYDRFVAEPRAGVRRLADFCGVTVEESTLATLAAGVRPDRGQAYRRRADLVRFAERVGDRLAAYGY